MAEHVPTTRSIRDMSIRGAMASPIARTAREAGTLFDRWLAAHEQQLREHIAAEIEDRADLEEVAFASSGLKGEFAEKWQGMRAAAAIARGGEARG